MFNTTKLFRAILIWFLKYKHMKLSYENKKQVIILLAVKIHIMNPYSKKGEKYQNHFNGSKTRVTIFNGHIEKEKVSSIYSMRLKQ